MPTILVKAPGGLSVKVNEPERGQFADNLGGAVQYTLVRVAYNVLQGLGDAIGTVGAGALVKFLEVVEPHLVEYVTPLLNGMLDLPELPGWLRQYMQEIKNPQHEAGAALLQGFAGNVVNGATNSLMGAVLAQTTYAINKRLRPSMPDVGALYGMFFRGHLSWDELADSVAKLGYHDRAITAFAELLRLRLGLGDLSQALARRKLSSDDVRAELRMRGMTDRDVDTVMKLSWIPLSVQDTIRVALREGWPRDMAVDAISALGYTRQSAGELYDLGWTIPGPNELVSMAVREAWRDDVAKRFGYDEDYPAEFEQAAKKVGLAPEWSRRYWRAHWTLPGINVAYGLMHRGIITQQDLETLLKTADYPKAWREWLVKGSYEPYTRVDVRRMHLFGVLSDDDLVRSYKDIGYDNEKAGKLAEFTIAYNAQADDPEGVGYKKLTQGLIATAYKRGVLGRNEALSMLISLGYRETDSSIILSIAEFQREVDAAPDMLKTYRADVVKVVERSYFKGLMSRGECLDLLGQIGYPQDQAEYVLASVDFQYAQYLEELATAATKELYVNYIIDTNDAIARLGREGVPGEMQSRLIHEWSIARDAHTKGLTEAQWRDMVRYELISPEQYKVELTHLGYTDRAADLLYRKLTYRAPTAPEGGE